jgi:hypothetical protein
MVPSSFYGAVIKDCPLVCKAQNMPVIDEVVVEVSGVSHGTTAASGFTIGMKWNWTNKVTGAAESIPTFF